MNLNRFALARTGLLLVAVVSALSPDPARADQAEPENPIDPRAPLPGILLAQPLGGGGAAVSSGGFSPCAEDAGHARALLRRFLSVGSFPHSPEAAEAAEAARVVEHPFTYQMELREAPDRERAVDRRGYPDLRLWQVVRCARLDFYNEAFGRSVTRSDPYPYEDVDSAHLEYLRLPDPVRRPGDLPDPERPAEWDSVAHLDPGFVRGLPLARTARPLGGLEGLEEVVDFLYRLERIPLEGFNQRGELVSRDALDLSDVWIVEDQVLWVVYDDAVPPGGRPSPPVETMVLHVVIYETASRHLAHYRLPAPESERDRPHVRVASPGDGFETGGRLGRPLVLRGNVAHGREILAPERMVWISSRDGRIATGLGTNLPASELSAGEHEITFRACDRQGRCDEDTVRIRVQER